METATWNQESRDGRRRHPTTHPRRDWGEKPFAASGIPVEAITALPKENASTTGKPNPHEGMVRRDLFARLPDVFDGVHRWLDGDRASVTAAGWRGVRRSQ